MYFLLYSYKTSFVIAPLYAILHLKEIKIRQILLCLTACIPYTIFHICYVHKICVTRDFPSQEYWLWLHSPSLWALPASRITYIMSQKLISRYVKTTWCYIAILLLEKSRIHSIQRGSIIKPIDNQRWEKLLMN